MDRMRAPIEFGFTTPPYVPPERRRPVWRTLLFGALLALIPIVGPGLSVVYVDRRRIPSTFEVEDALKTVAIQLLAVVALSLLLWLAFGLLLGVRVDIDVALSRT